MYFDCEWEAFTSVFFSMYVVIKSTEWWSKRPKHVVDDSWICSFQTVALALAVSTDFDQQTQRDDVTRMFSYWMLTGGLRFVVVDVVCALFLLRSFCFCYVLSYFLY
jgi:hypothetical protein